jgi:AcrR family transcriptional regulator
MAGLAERPLRADARRNRAAVLAAAREVFSEQGVDAPMEALARRAGVGVGTVYRHFPTKDALLQAMVFDTWDQLAVDAQAALAAGGDPWDTFCTVFWTVAERLIADRALSESLASRTAPLDACGGRLALQRAAAELVRRAQDGGRMRPDLVVDDVPMLVCGIGSSLAARRDGDPAAWRRHVRIVLDGLRADAATEPLSS